MKYDRASLARQNVVQKSWNKGTKRGYFRMIPGFSGGGPQQHELPGETAFPDPVIRITAAGFLLSIALSPRLWFDSERVFPSFPAVGFFAPGMLDLPIWNFASPLLPVLLVLSLCALLRWPLRGGPLVLTLISTLLLVVFDVHRLQPWLFQFALTFGLAAFLRWGKPFEFVSALRFLLFGTYLWSGLQKMNPAFAVEVLPAFLEPVLRFAPMHGLLPWFGMAIPLAEACLGVGLLVPRLARWSGFGLIAMHAIILLILGPLGKSTNAVVWPWNAVMIALLLVVSVPRTIPPLQPVRTWTGAWPILALVTLTPALGTFGLWPSYLSMSMYSGNVTRVFVLIDKEDRARVPEKVREFVHDGGDFPSTLSVANWGFCVLGVPGFPEQRPLEHAGNAFRNRFLEGRGELTVKRRAPLFQAPW